MLTLNIKKIKLKKKWRFWRAFKYFFLKKSIIFKFNKVKLFFNHNRILLHFITTYYGDKAQSLLQKKILNNSKFVLFLSLIELKLNIILVRMHFAYKIIESNFLIRYGFIVVNGVSKRKNYIVKINDIVQKYIPLGSTKFKKTVWRKFSWRTWVYQYKKNKKKQWYFYWQRRHTISMNFMETNYKILSSIIIRKPLLGETMLRKHRHYSLLDFIKRIFYVY